MNSPANCWLLLISGSGNAKTETVGALSLVPLLLVVGALPRPEPVLAPGFVSLDRSLPAGPSVLRHTRVLRGPPVVLAA